MNDARLDGRISQKILRTLLSSYIFDFSELKLECIFANNFVQNSHINFYNNVM